MIKPATVVAARTRRDGNLLARYNSGEFETVWREIRSYSHIDGEFRDEVFGVADATMRRVAHNADLLADRLRECGWLPLPPDDLRTRPSPEDEAVFQKIVEITGSPIPPTLLAFWRTVGGINWVWNYRADHPKPSLGVILLMDEMDPLCVYPASVATEQFDEWNYQKQQADPNLIEPFWVDLAPDYLHKVNISGGSPYAVALPFLGADPVYTGGRELPFVDYLRLAFRWAGFPSLENYAERADVKHFVAEFGRTLCRSKSFLISNVCRRRSAR